VISFRQRRLILDWLARHDEGIVIRLIAIKLLEANATRLYARSRTHLNSDERASTLSANNVMPARG